MKKLISLILAGGITASALTGCGKASATSDFGLTPLTLSEVAHSIFYAPQYAPLNTKFPIPAIKTVLHPVRLI